DRGWRDKRLVPSAFRKAPAHVRRCACRLHGNGGVPMVTRPMGFWYRRLMRPWLFRLEPEHAHELAMRALSLLASPALAPVRRMLHRRSRVRVRTHDERVRLFGLDFPNRVGLAAGFDKNGVAWPALAALGFGHVEIGTV